MRIRELREARDILQKDLATAMGVGQNTVSQWETEVTLPNPRQIPQLAEVLSCTIDELFVKKAPVFAS